MIPAEGQLLKPTSLAGLFICILAFSCPVQQIHAAPLDETRATAFLEALLAHPDSMADFLDTDDLAIANRLGISYPEAPCKPLISWGLSEQEGELLDEEGLDGQFVIQDLDGDYSRLTLFPDGPLASHSWIFRDGRVVSSILYGIGNWRRIDSEHFRFFVSDTTLFHPANIEALESFLTDTAVLLGMTQADLDRLARNKIYYCFCSSTEEIEELTGFQARGMYILSHDLIVSTYSAHTHELAHLLMNYTLQTPHLYTHPFLLEGFAVAVGGRGGKAPDILGQLGVSILKSGWLELEGLLDTQGFYRENASMSYPGTGVYNRFLLEDLGSTDYLELYDRYGGSGQAVLTMRIDNGDLPDQVLWLRYLEEQSAAGAISPGAPGLEQSEGTIAFQPDSAGTRISFAVPRTSLAFEGPPAEDYRSFLFEELQEGEPYAGQRYFVRASGAEAAVYDLYTNTMLAFFSTGFSPDPVEIPEMDGRYFFQVDASVFSGE